MKTIEIDIQHALSFTGREAYDSLSQEAVKGIEILKVTRAPALTTMAGSHFRPTYLFRNWKT